MTVDQDQSEWECSISDFVIHVAQGGNQKEHRSQNSQSDIGDQHKKQLRHWNKTKQKNQWDRKYAFYHKHRVVHQTEKQIAILQRGFCSVLLCAYISQIYDVCACPDQNSFMIRNEDTDKQQTTAGKEIPALWLI